MPAHLGFMGRVNALRAFFHLNLSQSGEARTVRNRHKSEEALRRKRGGGDGKVKSGFVTPGFAEHAMRDWYKKRESEYKFYSIFRSALDRYNPGRALERGERRDTTVRCDEREWDLYLKPDTAFDQNCLQYFEDHKGDPGFKVLLIRHKGTRADMLWLKRIEGVHGSGKVDILWTDAT